MALMSLFQGPSSLEKIKAKLAAKGREIHAAEARHRAAALEAALADDDAALAPLITEIAAMNAERQLLAGALAEAERLEQERQRETEAEEDRRRREAEERESKARFRASVQYLSRVQRGAEKAQTIITDLAEAVGEMRAGMASYHGVFGGRFPYRAFDIDGLLASELSRAGRKHGVELPGAVGDGGDPTLTAAIKDVVKVLTNRAEQMLVRGLTDPTEPPEPSHGVKPATPEPPRRARLSYIECETLRRSGRDPSAVIFVPQTGRSYRREQLQAEFGWTFDHEGNPITWPMLPAVEALAPPPGRDDHSVQEQQRRAGQAADRAFLRSQGWHLDGDGRVIGRADPGQVEQPPPAATSEAAPEPPPLVHGVQHGAIYDNAKISLLAARERGEHPVRPTHPEAAAAWDATFTIGVKYEAEMAALVEHETNSNAVVAEPATGSSARPADDGAAILSAPDAATAATADEVY